MKQLTRKELSAYLPYGLKVQWIREDDNKVITSVLTISDYPFLITRNRAKPILRPLSDLTKEHKTDIGRIITDRDSDFHEALAIDAAEAWIRGGMRPVMSLKTALKVTEYLFSIHADVFNLIPQNLAIDLNTL